MDTDTAIANRNSSRRSFEDFQQHRSRLFAIAYRMLGSVMDAEDMVQETFLRWQKESAADIQSNSAYLTTIMTRLCIDHLRSARVRREQYIGPWLPEPLITDRAADPIVMAELANSLSMAFLVMLERLSPIERAVFLLKEVFDYRYEDIAPIVEKSPANCRQIARRSRQHLALDKSRFQATSEQHEQLTQKFIQAFGQGDLDSLLEVLADDVTAWSDGGGKAVAALKPLHGAQKVARFLRAIYRQEQRQGRRYNFQLTQINGQPGWVYSVDGVIQTVLSIEIHNHRVQSLYFVRNPDKLRHCYTL